MRDISALSGHKRLKVVEFFQRAYYNTDQDAKLFAPEFFHLTGEILDGKIPTGLTFLSEYEDDLDTLIQELESKNPVIIVTLNDGMMDGMYTDVEDAEFYYITEHDEDEHQYKVYGIIQERKLQCTY